MIISPPFLRDKDATQSDVSWVTAMMPVNELRGFPLNGSESWHGGIHITHTDSGASPEKVRAIADGTVVSFRKPSSPAKRDQYPLRYAPLRGTDNGYVLLKHETEIGSGENGRVVYYSLYMHLKYLEAEIKTDAKIWRKSPLGSSGMTDGKNEFHFQVFCDEANIRKLTGRTTGELNIQENGRTDAIYGDIHFYLPAGTTFYEARPADNTASVNRLNEVHTSAVPLYVSMTLSRGACTMVTRQASAGIDGAFQPVGSPLINADGEDYEYNLYKTATSRYPQSPSAGYELLRFGRIINTEHETLRPADAPLWMTVNFPGGKGVVNLAVAAVKKFSDADFPHWTGWQLIDDDLDMHSQCNSAAIRKLQEEEGYAAQSSRLICRFPFEWEKSTLDARYKWLVTGLPWEQCTAENRAIWQMPGAKESKDRVLMIEEDYDRFKQHAEALCFDSGELGAGNLWHFDPRGFIEHFRKCNWLSKQELKQLVPLHGLNAQTWSNISYNDAISSTADRVYISLNKTMQKYLINEPLRIACFLGNAIQETAWLSTTHEFYQYTERDRHTRTITRRYNIWYYPWHGRGLLQLTNPENYFNYFSFRGFSYPVSIKNRLSTEYERLYRNSSIRYTDNHLGDELNTDLPSNVIEWRRNVDESDYEPTDSAGFYWCSSKMAKYSDSVHELERCSVTTNVGLRVYYRSQAFWKASAAVNLPGRVNDTHYRGLNGFDARCCVYGSAISVLTEMKFPDGNGNFVLEIPESNQLRR